MSPAVYHHNEEYMAVDPNGTPSYLVMAYLVARDLVVPLVRKWRGREGSVTPEGRVRALEVDLREAKTRIIDLGKELTDVSTAADNKLDLILEESRETRELLSETREMMGQRLAKVETHVEHLLMKFRGRT